ncbi:U-box domain-containing protein [Drosera capensis]
MTTGNRSTPGGGGVEDGRVVVAVAVAIDNSNRSRYALRWALENNVVVDGRRLVLVHVIREPNSGVGYASSKPIDTPDRSVMELFLPFRCYCTRKQVQCEVVVLQNLDVARALISYVSNYAVNTLILGTSSKKNIGRYFKSNVSSNVIKGAPDFCNVYLISRGKVSSARHATHPTPYISASHRQLFAPLRLDDATEAIMSTEDMHNTKYDELTVQNDCSSFSSSEESSDFFVSDNEKASELICQAKKSECDQNITELSAAISDNRGPCSQNSSSIVPDHRRRSVSSLLVEIENNKNALETKNGNESGSTVRGRRRRNKAKAVEACDAAHKSAQDAALSMVKQAEPGKVVGDAVAKIYRIIVYQAIFNVMVVFCFIGWQVWN